MATRVRQIAPEIEVTVIPMGTDLRNTFVPPPEHRRLPLRNMVFVGRLVEKKGVTHLLDAMQIVAARYPDVSLDIVGHGPLREQLEQKGRRLGLDGCVNFLGPIPHGQLPLHYQKADIAVFPFVEAASGDQEGFGLVMVEAMGCGCLVIACDLPAVRDVIGLGERGILVESPAPEALAGGIISALSDESSGLAIGANGRAYALSHFDWTVCGQKYSTCYRVLQEAAR
jgi:phosphatidyl-myo-inositol dimannoside synthase